jgi:hypothetical protein
VLQQAGHVTTFRHYFFSAFSFTIDQNLININQQPIMLHNNGQGSGLIMHHLDV